MNENKKAFTLTELLLVIAIMGIIFLVAPPIYGSFETRNDLQGGSDAIAQSLRRAMVLSQAVDGDSAWGVYVQTQSVTVFKGATYAGRDTAYDEVFNFPTTLQSISGTTEFDFSKFSGLPTASGTVTLTSQTNETSTIAINSEGGLTY